MYKDPLLNTVYDKFGGHFFYCQGGTPKDLRYISSRKTLRRSTSNSGVVTVKTLYSWSWSMVNIFRAKRATIASPNFRAPNGSCLRPISPRLLRTKPGTPKPSFFLKRRREVFFLHDLVRSDFFGSITQKSKQNCLEKNGRFLKLVQS